MKQIILVLLLCACSAAQQPTKSILVSVHVENEGPAGLWVQSGKDLASPELAKFQELLDANFAGSKDVQLVQGEDKRDHVEIVVSATKVPRGQGNWYYAVSSVIGLARPDIDIFISHNVIVADDISTIAKAVGFSFSSLRLRLALQLKQ